MKTVIVINGTGGAGKDTVVRVVGNHYSVMNVSSIQPVKDAAIKLGVDPDDFHKDRTRRLLSDIKKLAIEYNNLPTQYLLGKFSQFMQSDKSIMFVHIREPKEIRKFINWANAFMQEPVYIPEMSNEYVRILTLFIKNRENREYGNDSDDGAAKYEYDYVYDNSGPLETLDEDFMKFFNENIGV